MSSLADARKKIEERRAQQQSQGGGGMSLWFRQDDIAIGHFICTGQDGDPYFDTYVAHQEPAKGQGQFPTKVYCPVESGHDGNYDCHGCREGLKTYDMMIMWIWVYDILHAQLKPNESTLPKVDWNGRTYFRREINAPRLWDTSAWRESCLDDILMLGSQLGSLHNTMVNIVATGSSMQRRYKVYMQPQSPPFPADLYEQAKAQIRPVIGILKDRLVVVPTMQAPAEYAPTPITSTPADSAPVAAYVPPGGATTIPRYEAPGQRTKEDGAAEPGQAAPAKAAGRKKNMF